MDIVGLAKLCDKNGRAGINKPFKKDGYIWATNGKWLVRIKESVELTTEDTSKINVNQFKWSVADNPDLKWLDVPSVEKDTCYNPCSKCNGTGKVRLCDTCKGSGEHECECGDLHTCRDCNGDGTATFGDEAVCEDCYGGKVANYDSFLDIGNNRFANWFIYELQQVLGKLQIVDTEYGIPVYFRFAGGDGYAMPMRKSNGRGY